MEAALRRDPRGRRRARVGQQVPIPRRPGGDHFRPRCSGPVAATRQPGDRRGPAHSASGCSYASVTVETQLSGSHVRHGDVFNPGLAQCACCTACDHGRGTRATSRAMPATCEVRAAPPPQPSGSPIWSRGPRDRPLRTAGPGTCVSVPLAQGGAGRQCPRWWPKEAAWARRERIPLSQPGRSVDGTGPSVCRPLVSVPAAAGLLCCRAR